MGSFCYGQTFLAVDLPLWCANVRKHMLSTRGAFGITITMIGSISTSLFNVAADMPYCRRFTCIGLLRFNQLELPCGTFIQ
jgi:hypothetical protein